MGLTELVTITEHFERTLDRDYKQRSAKLMAIQLQQFRARDQSNTYTSHRTSSGAHHQKSVPGADGPL